MVVLSVSFANHLARLLIPGMIGYAPDTSLSTSTSHPGFSAARCVSIFLMRPSTFLRRLSTVSFDSPADQ